MKEYIYTVLFYAGLLFFLAGVWIDEYRWKMMATGFFVMLFIMIRQVGKDMLEEERRKGSRD